MRDARAVPTYSQAVTRYNERVAPLGRLFARTVVVISYTDDEGRRKQEQGEGFLQVVRPDRLAMSVSKVGKRLLWFGSDAERYWWIDLVEDKVAYVGRHENYDAVRAAGVVNPGLGIRPLDLVQMLGIMPLPSGAAGEGGGATQWSADGRRLGIVARRPGVDGQPGGIVRVWVDPGTYEALKVELFNSDRELQLVSDLLDYRHPVISTIGGSAPRVPSKLLLAGAPAGPLGDAELRMSIEGVEDARVNDDAFRFAEIVEQVGVERVVDLDEQAGIASGSGRADPVARGR